MKGEAAADERAAAAAAAASAAAAAAVAAESSDEPFGRKRRCHVWLDALFRALYCDLQVHLLTMALLTSAILRPLQVYYCHHYSHSHY